MSQYYKIEICSSAFIRYHNFRLKFFFLYHLTFFSRFSWKDQNNDFKKTLKLTGVPTLLKYGTVRNILF